MILEVRCYTCGKRVSGLWTLFIAGRQAGKSDVQISRELGLKRICCRRMLTTHTELINKILVYDVMTRRPSTFEQLHKDKDRAKKNNKRPLANTVETAGTKKQKA